MDHDDSPPDLEPPNYRHKGWKPDPLDPTRKRYWNGKSWAKTSANDSSAANGSADEMADQQTVEPTPLAIGLSYVGVALVVIGVFLPQLESSFFTTIEKNSLIQNGDGFIFLVIAGAAAFGTYLFTRGQGHRYSVLIAGIACLLLAIYDGTGERLELESVTSPGTNQFGLQRPSQTQKANAGIGIYAVGAGGALIALGGVMLAGLAVGGVEPKPLRRSKKCPHCAETVLAEAKVCKHCGRDLPM